MARVMRIKPKLPAYFVIKYNDLELEGVVLGSPCVQTVFNKFNETV